MVKLSQASYNAKAKPWLSIFLLFFALLREGEGSENLRAANDGGIEEGGEETEEASDEEEADETRRMQASF